MTTEKANTHSTQYPDLKTIANTAHSILFSGTKYQTDRKVIEEIFNNTKANFSIESIITRLTIIDSYYSTQMNKRYYGIEDLAKELFIACGENEKTLTNLFVEITEEPYKGDILKVFNHENYGIHKNGKEAGKAISLISKYAFFQTQFNFPIYDRLAKVVFPLLMNRHFHEESKHYSINTEDISNYIQSISKLNEISLINDFDKLDNLLWLCGKILDGNFSMILKNKKSYKKLAEKVESSTKLYVIKNGKEKKRDFSLRILEYISNNPDTVEDLVKDDKLTIIIKFALELKE